MYSFTRNPNSFNSGIDWTRLKSRLITIESLINKYRRWVSLLKYWKYPSGYLEKISLDRSICLSFMDKCMRDTYMKRVDTYTHFAYKNLKKKLIVAKLEYRIGLLGAEYRFLQEFKSGDLFVYFPYVKSHSKGDGILGAYIPYNKMIKESLYANKFF